MGGGGGGAEFLTTLCANWSLGLGEILGLPPLNETLVCMCAGRTPLFLLFFFGWLRWLLPGYT